MNEIVNEWLISRNIIADFLRELRPDQDANTCQRNAAAIIARLAQHVPPILTGFARPEPKPDADLLAACESVLDWLHSFGIPSTTTAAEKAAAILTLEVAIAKAKGGAS